jgi:GNAT superfamily N-acetyltransferase
MELRAITDDEVTAFRECIMQTFGDDPQDADPDGDRRLRATLPLSQAWAVFDRGTVVATAGSFDLQLGMPGGGSLSCAGLTVVTVRPTHRRRGLLTQLMARYLDDARARGRAIGGLWASEAVIYGRFGFGIAAWGDAVEITGAHQLTIAGAGDDVELADEARAREVLPDIYARATAQRPGVLRRGDVWWRERRFIEAPYMRKGASRRRHVLAVRDGAPVGYVQYRQRGQFNDGRPSGKLDIIELVGVDARATASLWKFACSVDLFPTVTWWNAPVDDPLIHLASDVRRVARRRNETLWLRIEDASAVLAARGFDGSVALRVGDRTYGRGPEVAVAPHVLPALVMGATRATELAQAGLLTGDVLAADRAFTTPVAPWCAEIF